MVSLRRFDDINTCLDDERANFKNVPVDGVIMAFADIGTWKGRRQGYKIYEDFVPDILYSSCEENEWYTDRWNVRSIQTHHDGTNYILYRVAKDRASAERIAQKIYNEEYDENDFMRHTKSLKPYFTKVYGKI